MQRREFDTGQMIEHARFGRGEVLKALGDFRDIWFAQLAETKRIRTDHLSLSPDQSRTPRRKPRAPSARAGRPRAPAATALDWAAALDAFARAFPGAFGDPAWLSGPRAPAEEASRRARAALAPGGALHEGAGPDGAQAAAALRDMLPVAAKGRVSLLSPFENMALQATLGDGEAALRLGGALRGAVAGGGPEDNEAALARYLGVVAALPATPKGSPAKWPVATLFLTMAEPGTHMFLKPVSTRRVAAALGAELDYQPTLNLATYRSLLGFAQKLSAALSDAWPAHPPRDSLDLQAFIAWCQEKR